MSIIKVLSIEDDGVAALACEGEINGLLMESGEPDRFEELLGEDWSGRQVVLDMSQASYLDSAAVGWLLSLHRSFTTGGGKLVLCCIQPTVRRVIDLMRIGEVVPILDDQQQAFAKIREAN